MKAEALAERCRRLRLVLSDVDGVLTDGRVWLMPGVDEGRSFHIRDGLGVVLAQRAGLRVGLLSGRASQAISQRARDLGIDVVLQGVDDKLAALRELLAHERLAPAEVAYVGDDLNDLGVLGEVGLSAAPADAAFEVRAQALMLLETPGGHGCLREFIEAILRARGQWEGLVAALGGRAF